MSVYIYIYIEREIDRESGMLHCLVTRLRQHQLGSSLVQRLCLVRIGLTSCAHAVDCNLPLRLYSFCTIYMEAEIYTLFLSVKSAPNRPELN